MIYFFRLITGLLFLFSLNTFAIDSDSDGIPDENDNCPNVANLECSMVNGQYTCIMPDADGDGIGDACEDFDVDLNTFENGQVADANQVNENFEKLKAAVEEIKILIDPIACLAAEGNYINGQCLNPEIEIEDVSIPIGSINFEVLNLNTSDTQYEASDFMNVMIDARFITDDGPLECEVQNENGTVYNLSPPASWQNWFTLSREIPIEYRGLHRLFCTLNNSTEIQVYEIAIDFRASSQDSDGDGVADSHDLFPADPSQWY